MSATHGRPAAHNVLCGRLSLPSGASDNIHPVSSVEILEHYDRWLTSTPLAARTRVNYRRWVAELVDDLIAGGELAAFLAPAGENERRAVLTDWRRRLGVAPSSARNPTVGVCRH